MNSTYTRIISKTPRFTSLEFWLPGGAAPVVPIFYPLTGKAIQLITAIDYNRMVVPLINGTDTETCDCVWEGTGDLATAVLPIATLNATRDTATFAAQVGSFTITTTVALPAGNLILTGPIVITGTCQASGHAATVTVPTGVSIVFPGGPAGVYVLNTPIFSGACVGAQVGDVTFTANGAVIAGIVYNGVGVMSQSCTSTWQQPLAGWGPWVNALHVPSVATGYVHLNHINDHVRIADGYITVQSIPVSRAPSHIRVVQEFNQLSLEVNCPVGDICAGYLIVEHETEKEI